jgi:hypothetical protein
MSFLQLWTLVFRVISGLLMCRLRMRKSTRGAVCEVEERAGEEKEGVGDAEEGEEGDEIVELRRRETFDQPMTFMVPCIEDVAPGDANRSGLYSQRRSHTCRYKRCLGFHGASPASVSWQLAVL